MVNECFLPVMNLFPENCRSIKNGCPSNIKNGDFPLMCRPAFLPVLYDLVIIPHPLTLFFFWLVMESVALTHGYLTHRVPTPSLDWVLFCPNIISSPLTHPSEGNQATQKLQQFFSDWRYFSKIDQHNKVEAPSIEYKASKCAKLRGNFFWKCAFVGLYSV